MSTFIPLHVKYKNFIIGGVLFPNLFFMIQLSCIYTHYSYPYILIYEFIYIYISFMKFSGKIFYVYHFSCSSYLFVNPSCYSFFIILKNLHYSSSDLQVKNYLSFCLSGNVFLSPNTFFSPSFLKYFLPDIESWIGSCFSFTFMKDIILLSSVLHCF